MLTFTMPVSRRKNAVNQGFQQTFSLYTLCTEANPTIIRIKQLKRSYSRRLKSVMLIFTSHTSSLDMLITLLISLSIPVDPHISMNIANLQNSKEFVFTILFFLRKLSNINIIPLFLFS